MPRRSTATLVAVEPDLPGLDNLDQDPAPAATRSRTRSRTTAKATGKRGPGRPPGTGPRTAGGRLMSKAAMQAKVSAELYTYLSLFAAGWEIRDPECASVLYEPVTLATENGPTQVERLQGIVDRLVAIISRNSKVLETLAKSGVIGELAMLGHLVFPIARAVWKAHGPMGVGHRPVEESNGDYVTLYPAHAAS